MINVSPHDFIECQLCAGRPRPVRHCYFRFGYGSTVALKMPSLTPRRELSTKRQGGGDSEGPAGLPKTLVWETESVPPSTHLTRAGWRRRQPLALGQQVQEAAESRDISLTSHHPQELLGPEGTQVMEGKRGAGEQGVSHPEGRKGSLLVGVGGVL